jgi:putative nucleotidyltransferase with HDIG domain
MRRLVRSAQRNAWLITAFVAPQIALFALTRIPALDVSHQSMYFHLLVVSTIAACVLAVALVAGVVAVRVRRPGVVLLAAGCLCCGMFMLVHGLVTPRPASMSPHMYHGYQAAVSYQPVTVWVGRAPVLAIFGFALFQSAASLIPNSRLVRVASARPIAFLGTLAAVIGAVAVIVVSDPSALHGDAQYPWEQTAARLAAVVAAALLLPTARAHWRRYRLGGDGIQAVLAIAAAMSVAAITSMQFGKLWHLSWWDYHLYLLAGFSAVAFTIFRRYRSVRTVDAVLASTFAVDPLEHISDNYPEALRALVNAVEVKDAYTHGHSRRTAEVATALGARLGLLPEDLRLLAQGAYLHDVGKIGIPDDILNKPQRLTAEEREIIERHAEVGAEMVGQAPSLRGCVDIVRHHHERFDGDGYPDQIAGSAIPRLARIAAVADVWDALTSDRAYRPGWPPEEALAHIVDGSGTHFDPIVVEALVQLAADWGYKVSRSEGDVGEALQAVEDCHEVGATSIPVLSRP